MPTSAANIPTSRRKRWLFRGGLCLVVLAALVVLLAGAELLMRAGEASRLDERISALEELVRSNVAYNRALFKGYAGREEEARIHLRDRKKAPFTYRPYIEHRRIPNFKTRGISTNSLGYRGGEFQVEKGDDVFRVLLYGGSFVWGTGALSDEETISGHLEKLLNQRVGGSKRFEVINCGESGYLSTQEAVFLLVEGVYLSPDLVVFLDGANDSAKAYQKLPAGYPFLFDRMNEVFSEGLRRRHREAFTIDNELEYFKRQRAVVWSPGSIVLLKRLGVLRQKASEQKPDAGEKFTTAEEYAIRHFSNVRCVRGLGGEFGFATAFAIQPMLIFFKPMHEDERQILEALKQYETYSNTHAWWEKHYRRYTDMVLAMCRDADISVLDLRRVFAGNSQPLYIDDVHLTGDGYYLIAEALCQWLTAEGLVAPARRSSGQSGVTTGR